MSTTREYITLSSPAVNKGEKERKFYNESEATSSFLNLIKNLNHNPSELMNKLDELKGKLEEDPNPSVQKNEVNENNQTTLNPCLFCNQTVPSLKYKCYYCKSLFCNTCGFSSCDCDNCKKSLICKTRIICHTKNFKCSGVKSRMSTIEHNFGNFGNKYVNLKGNLEIQERIYELEDKIAIKERKSNQEIMGLKREREHLEKKITELKSYQDEKIKTVKKEYNKEAIELKKENEFLKKKIIELKSENTETTHTLINKEKNEEIIELKSDNMATTCTLTNKEIIGLKKEKEHLEKRIDKLKNDHDDFNIVKERLDRKRRRDIIDLEETISSLKDTIFDMKKKRKY